MNERFRPSGNSLATTSASTSQSNRLAEAPDKTLLDTVQTRMNEAGMKEAFWEKEMYQEAYLDNQTVTKTLHMRISHEFLFKFAPNNSRYAFFGPPRSLTRPK